MTSYDDVTNTYTYRFMGTSRGVVLTAPYLLKKIAFPISFGSQFSSFQNLRVHYNNCGTLTKMKRQMLIQGSLVLRSTVNLPLHAVT